MKLQLGNLSFLVFLFLLLLLMGCDLSQPLSKNNINKIPSISALSTNPAESLQITETLEISTPIVETEDIGAINTPIPTSINSWQQGKIAYMVWNDSGSDLKIIDLENNVDNVILTSPSQLGFLGLSFSGDGEKLAYCEYPKELFVTQVNQGKLPRRLYTCQSPSFSSDGTQILCVSARLNLVLISSNDGSLVKKIDLEKDVHLSDLSKADDRIVFSVRNGGDTEIWQTSTNGLAEIFLAGAASENYVPVWSPDGKQIAYQSNDGSINSEIWIMDKDGQNKQRISYTQNGGWSRGPSWSPNGKFLAYVSNQNGSIGSDRGEIFVVSLVTGDTIQVTNTGGRVYDWRIAWGP